MKGMHIRDRHPAFSPRYSARLNTESIPNNPYSFWTLQDDLIDALCATSRVIECLQFNSTGAFVHSQRIAGGAVLAGNGCA